MNKINTHSNLMDIVEKNVHDDGLERGFDYINLAKFGNPNYTMNLYIEQTKIYIVAGKVLCFGIVRTDMKTKTNDKERRKCK